MIQRGIVIVHGVGDQRRSEQLDIVVEPLVRFLEGRVGDVELVTRTHRDGGEATASATIRLTPAGAAQPAEEWHIREAWWSQSFEPSNSATILGWAVLAFFVNLWATVSHILLRNLRRVAPVGGRPQPQGTGVWAVPVAGNFWYPLLDALNWALITAGYLAGYAAGFVFIVPVYVFLLLPVLPFLPAPIGNVQRRLINLFTGGIGDQHAMTNRQVAVTAAANAVSTALWPFLNPNALKQSGRAYETVTVIAHSGGCVVSFAALAGGEVKRWLAGEPRGRRVNWVTVGSGLNLAWRMRAPKKPEDRRFWERRRLDGHVNWIDIYARYDPVPQGHPPEDLVTELMGPEPAPGDPPRPFVDVRVANHDWPFSDHGAYWWNSAEVLSRIVHVVTDSRLGKERLDPQSQTAGTGMLGPALQADVAGAWRHRRRVSLGQFMRGAAVLAVAVLLVQVHAALEVLGRYMLDLAGWPWPPQGLWLWLTGLLPQRLPWTEDTFPWLVGSAVLLYAGMGALRVVGLVRELIDWRRG